MKKVLIVTYYWPPAGGPGVQRILKFSKYLPEYGWQPIILTVNNPSSPAVDESLLSQIPEICKIYKTNVLEPFSIYKKFLGLKKEEQIPNTALEKKEKENLKNNIARWIRANIFIPDARIGWLPFGIKKGIDIIKKENIDLIFSTSPPHSTQLIAKKLAHKCCKKWIADFRDPWTDYYKILDLPRINIIKNIDLKLEKSVLKKVNYITTVSNGYKDLFFNKVTNDYYIIYTGLEKIQNKIIKSDKFIILYFGHLSSFQNPINFFKAIDLLPSEIKTKVEIIFVGKIYDGFKYVFEKYNNLNIKIKDYIPYNKLLDFAQKASLLLTIIQKGTGYSKGYVQLKIFDYLALQRPILALGEKNSITEKILQDTRAGNLFNYNDIRNTSDFILDKFKEWERRKYLSLDNTKFLERYTTKFNVEKLVKIFNSLHN